MPEKEDKRKDTLKLFHPVIKGWFNQKFPKATEIQILAWPKIAKGDHVLVTAPTGSGKTLTAFLWAINKFLVEPQSLMSNRVLYISPLKALNNDIKRNLTIPLVELEEEFERLNLNFPNIKVGVRSGDTEPSERRQMRRLPPEIFITTPESLNILLASKSGQKLLLGISTVILDEIHAVIPSKRGTYLITAVDRLVTLNGDFQRIALSATVKPLKEIAQFVGGYKLHKVNESYTYTKRKVSIIKSKIRKRYNISVRFPKNINRKSTPDTWWGSLVDDFRKIIASNRSSLFFTNSRRMVEKVTRLINDKEETNKVYSHHGSLSREIRSLVEKRFKKGELSGIISTSSLELGIDIGAVDMVVLIQPPHSISSTIQRIGRSGHGVGQISRGVFYPIHQRIFLDAAVLAANIDRENIESISPRKNPLDVLAQVILSMASQDARDIDHLYAEIRSSFPYHHLDREEFNLVLEMLAGKYSDSRIRQLKPRVILDKVTNTIKARENSKILLFLSGGVIPDRGYYNLRLADTKAKIGELDEEFVWERSIGDKFPMGNQLWRIQRITPNDVEVSPAKSINSVIPFWRAEEMNRSFFLSEKIGELLEEAEAELDTPQFKENLKVRNHMAEPAANHLISFLKRQKTETSAPLPHKHHILVEHCHNLSKSLDSRQVIFHTMWGGQVNRPLALAISVAWERRNNSPLEIFVNNDCFMLNLTHDIPGFEILSMVSPERIRHLLRKKLESTGYFGARFRENAQRALLLPRHNFLKRMPLWLNRLRSKKLLESISKLADFPILLETWRDCLNYEFDLDALTGLLEKINLQEIKITDIETTRPSPFAEGILWHQTKSYVYRDDTPSSKIKSKLSDNLLRELFHSSQLRPKFSQDLIQAFQKKLLRLSEGYSPATAEELLQWIKERLYIPAGEWGELMAAIIRDHNIDPTTWISEISNRLYFLKKENLLKAVIALENLPRVSNALGIVSTESSRVAKKLKLTNILNQDSAEVFHQFLGEWLSFYGPVPQSFLSTTFDGNEEKIAGSLKSLYENGDIVVDEFREDSPTSSGSTEAKSTQEICDTQNLEILYRIQRSRSRPFIDPKEIDDLPLFLATHQGLTSAGDSVQDLQNCLEFLFGYPAKASLWETDILPARLVPYYNDWLDTVLRDNDLLWFGCGKERLSFCFDSDLELFVKKSPSSFNEETLRIKSILEESGGKFTFGSIAERTSLSTEKLSNSLWDLAWKGQVTNDNFSTLRKGVLNRFQIQKPQEIKKRRGRYTYNRWKSERPFLGNWHALNPDNLGFMDALDRQELVKDQIRQLSKRFGILFREILTNELPFLKWSKIFPVLRLMELSGELLSGQFFKGLPGLQFCTPQALTLLMNKLPDDKIYWMNAADPASLCGVDIEALKNKLPSRLPTTHLVFQGGQLVLISKRNGKELIIKIKPDHPNFPKYLEFFKVLLTRDFSPLTYISIDTINTKPALDSEYKNDLQEFGFKKDLKSLILLKSYDL